MSDVGLRDADDAPIWQHAVSNNAVIVTKDEDFANRKAAKAGGPRIIWVRIGNCSNKARLNWFVPLLPAIVKRLEDGEAIIELV